MHILPSFFVGGAEQMAGYLMVGLSDAHELSGVTLRKASESPIEKRLEKAQIPVWHLGKSRGFSPRMFFELDRLLGEVRPDVVHTHLSVLRYAIPALLHHKIGAVIHTLHSIAERENDVVGRALQWFAFRGLVTPVAISQEVAASFKRVYGVECPTIVPNCIPVERYRAGIEERNQWREKEGIAQDAIVLTSVGRLERVKNHALLLQAFAAVKDPRAQLVMIGDGSLKFQLMAYAKEHKLEDRVHILGPRSDVPLALAASDIFVLSSLWEGSPLSVMEAMAAGLPVIGTAVGGVPELVRSEEQGILVPPGDGPRLASAMRCLVANDYRRSNYARAACAHAHSHFGIDRMVDGYTAVYRNALLESSRVSAESATDIA